MVPLEIVSAIAGVIIPQGAALIRSIFGRKNAEPEKVLGDLATNKPETLPLYIDALGRYWEAQAKWFNRDMMLGGQYPAWLLSLRGGIRPALVGVSVLALIAEGAQLITTDAATRSFWTFMISSWVGDRQKVGL